MIGKVSQIMFNFITTGGLLGLCSYVWCSADFWRKWLVKRYLLSEKKFPSYDLPKFEIAGLSQTLIDTLRTRDPLLIDGPSGAGKTAEVRNVVAIMSRAHKIKGSLNSASEDSSLGKRYATAYICLRIVNPETMTVPLAKQWGYIGKGANHDNVDQALDCLRDVIHELHISKGVLTEIFIDDIDRTFDYGKQPTRLGKCLVAELGLRISDLKAGKTFFVTSDNFVFGEMRKISGVDKRLEYFPFPTVTESMYIKYIDENKSFFSRYETPNYDFKRFYRVFGANMRSIDNLIKCGKSMEGIR